MEFNFLGARIKNNGDIFEHHANAKMALSFRAQRMFKNRTEFIQFDPVNVKFNRETVTKLKISNLFDWNKILEECALILSDSDF